LNGLDEATDECLLERTRRGDATAFQQLYERHRDTTFRFACLMLGSSEHAEDVTHDCFLGLIRDPGRFNPRRASLRTYLYASARNLVLKRLRRWGKESSSGDSRKQESTDSAKEPLQSLLDQELVDDVRKALARLPHSQR
jgi:RNA polymerase sigma-70 factor (ECF subfamily)